jgi:hypothetical protein
MKGYKANSSTFIISQTNGSSRRFACWYLATGKVGCGFYNGSSYNAKVTTDAIQDNTWYNLVLVHQSDQTNNLFLNAITQPSSGSTSSPGTTANGNFILGANSLGTEGYYNGSLSDVTIWNRSLTDAEVQQWYQETSKNYNITASIPTYFNQSASNVNISNNYQFNTSQSEVRFQARDLVTQALIPANFTVGLDTKANNTVFYFNTGSWVVKTTSTGYQNKSETRTVTAFENDTQTIYNMSNALANISMSLTKANATETNYSMTISNAQYGFSAQAYTNGNQWARFNLTQGLPYNVTVSGTNITTTTYLLSNNMTSALPNITLPIYSRNSINITIYDEQSLDIINETAITVNFISNNQTYSYQVTNGSLFVDLLVGQQYEVRYFGSGYSARSTSFTLTEDTGNNQLSLYLASTLNSTLILITVVEQLGTGLPDANVKVLKYFVEDNNFRQVASLTTNYLGQAITDVYLNSEYYKFIVEYPVGTVKLISPPQFIISTSLILKIPTEAIVTYPEAELDNITTTLTYNNISHQFVYTYSNALGTDVQGCIKTYSTYQGVRTALGTVCSSAVSGVLYSNLTYNNNTDYLALGYVTVGDFPETLTDTLLVERLKTAFNDDSSGVFYLILLLIVVALLTAFSPLLAIVATPLFIVIFLVMGLISTSLISVGSATLLVIVGLVIGFIIHRRSN